MTVKEMRTRLGITQSEFAEKYNIPIRTIQNWECGSRECPQYVLELLEFKVMYDIENK